MLTKDLLRVSRPGGGYRPQFIDADREPLAAQLLDTYREHVSQPRHELDAAVEAIEREATDFKLVRGLAKLLDREAVFETRAPVSPDRARTAAFEAAERIGVTDADERERALAAAGDRLDVDPAAIDAALYADRDRNQVLTAFDSRWTPAQLIEQYNLSLAQTALFDAVEVRVRSTEPAALISAVKRLRLMYEIRRERGDADPDVTDVDVAIDRTAEDRGGATATEVETAPGEGALTTTREVVVTGPTALFGRSRRYGTRFARLLRTVASASAWRLAATIDDRGTERDLVLETGDVTVPGVEPVTEMTFDSGVEAAFASRFRALELDWRLVREPDPLAAGTQVMIPDFAFDWAPGGDPEAGPPFRVYFEVMGFWTPEYVEKKLAQLEDVETVALLVAVDEDLGVGERVEARADRAIPYTGHVRLKDVRDALRPYERRLIEQAGAGLPTKLRPEADVITLADLAAEHGVAERTLSDRRFPEHERVGRTLIRPAVLDRLADRLAPGMRFDEVGRILETAGIADASATLARLGYRVTWDGLSGGTLRRVDGDDGSDGDDERRAREEGHEREGPGHPG